MERKHWPETVNVFVLPTKTPVLFINQDKKIRKYVFAIRNYIYINISRIYMCIIYIQTCTEEVTEMAAKYLHNKKMCF